MDGVIRDMQDVLVKGGVENGNEDKLASLESILDLCCLMLGLLRKITHQCLDDTFTERVR